MESLVSQLTSFYQGKKVFVTGHTGFKGAWMTAYLHHLGAIVKGYALAPQTDQDLYYKFTHLDNVESIIGDIRDKQKMAKAIQSFQPEYIFHLAAQPLVRRSYEIPAETFEVNVAGTANVLEEVTKLNGPCTVVVITTDKVYDNKEKDILYKEDDELGGYDPYSASKACAELVVNSFRNSFFNPSSFDLHKKTIASARAGNVIGGGDWNKDRIIPDIIRSLMSDQIIEVRNPSAVRPWQHVLEPLTGYLLLGGLLHGSPAAFSKAYNFGPDPTDHLPVRSLVEFAINIWGKGEWKHTGSVNQPHEAGLLKLDINRAINELHWYPKLSAAQAIGWAIEWYRQPVDQQASYTLEQIKRYLQL